MKWSPVYHVSTIFGNHVTAGVLWVKMTFQPACKQSKWRPDRTKFGGEIVSQTRVPPVSTPMNNLFSTPRVNRIRTRGREIQTICNRDMTGTIAMEINSLWA